MAVRAFPVSTKSGISAAALVVTLILGALCAVISRAEAGMGFVGADWSALRFTVWQAFLSALFSVILAVPLARALARRRFAGRGVLVTLLGAPFILPVIVAVLGLLTIFGRSGWLNGLLAQVGLPSISIYGLHGVVLAHVFFNLPLATRLLLQGWQTVPAERFRLAAQLRLTPWAMFRVIEMPLLRQIVPGVAALIFVICLTSFAVALTLGGGPKATTLELAIYQAFRFDFDLGRAALLSVVQLGVAGGAALVALWVLPVISLGGGQDRPQRRWDARGGVQRGLDGAVIALGTAFLVLPLLAVVLRGLSGMTQMPTAVWAAAGSSLFVAVISVMVLIVLMLPMAGWIASKRAGGVEAIGLLGLSASPLMIGTGWFIVINPVMNPADLALPVTALVNALMALPFCLRIVVPRLRDTVQDFGRLSASLGLRGWPLWRWVILPRLAPQLGFATGLTGALSMGDLGVIALFADTERATLPLQMYRLMGAYRMEAAAGAALLLLVMALGIFWACDAMGRRYAAA
ncbi:thiamine/thiamine pyrophosphate ABC transporter permease ThiP [Sulfitobacter geojensis]|uniref:Thiamine/thiamine pyrophosphate ABC transporter permease ThiP n=1 Tax=Sulfitobacter geojensis TaxID=1342299 RepID=A0AAE2VXP1_9RHOB|nr:thiamine/thiamine pyrophosphate ABC transporter permease ThiP [Sulfitobacter geojensis]MBM1689294.1 thiamine/thiamine pyrophosphate ABC transporter permease ThiP [Sulfitobacter geojensis]MBM1693360.1 thiamine/thiamine pyrophosphate ABC transporter permease ThiP [Sulfitobacter geojensis]MBM1705526.1 thiamine/thiamine pyrophosphate ABC transporter permease ThiP [Sulfitobacter geojensis]MBM1709584.1 thiamine/thiamine pyrophosphate ABC transporter permease ThiP [Sulfitobacter geojensis]MBM17136